tara:strand:+ start:16 stop:1179 length:1164 start_codon:yes stop_codon:yes gene_type:complete
MNIIHEIDLINNKFSINGSKLRIEKRGNKLNIRGSLPAKDNKAILKIQRISLGLNANISGLKEAQKKLQLINLQLELDQFQWSNWSSNQRGEDNKINNFLFKKINDFENTFFDESKNISYKSSRKTTWNSAYKPYIKRMITTYNTNENKELNNIFINTLKSYKAGTRSRKQCGTSLHVFAEFIDHRLPPEWKSLSKGYGLKKASFRNLPDDQLIENLWKNIPNKSWQYVFALMATYGLRNHEVFFCDLSTLKNNGDKILRIFPTTKTGEHQVWPFHPKWVDLFDLSSLGEDPNLLPKINRDLRKTTLQNIGKRITDQFNRYKLNIRPYDLRHAWAVRTIFYDLPDTVSARMMGHSVSLHTQTYHHWITKRDQQKAVTNALLKFEGNH